MKLIGLIILLALVGGGVYYFTQQAPVGKLPAEEATLGSYAYECTNNVTMRMEPSEGMETIRVMISGAGFPSEAILTHVESFTGARFEGANMMFTGKGEEAQMVSGDNLVICNPVFDSENAPWNWGDGEVVFDPVASASVAILGSWNLIEADVVAEFKEGGVLTEDRAGQISEGTWSMSAPADAPVVTMSFEGNPHSTSCEVTLVTANALLLSCTGEGERFELSYTR